MPRRLPALVCALSTLVAAAALGAPPAAAQDDEVIVDPRSPSGTEYAVPIDRARREAGTSTSKRSGSQGAPLFGEGVGDTPSNAERADGDSAGDRRKAQSQFPDRSREVERGRTRALQVQAAAAQDGWIGIGGIIAGGIGVLLVGGLIGLWLRRRAST